jgi:hypothetical protein
MEAEIVRKVKAELDEHPDRTQKSVAEDVGLTQAQVSLIKSGRYDHLLVRTPPTLIPPEMAAIVSPESIVHLVATSPAQMASAQDSLVRWFRLKVTAVDAEVEELSAAVAEAEKNGWNKKTLQSQRSGAIVRRTFYEKCLLASDAGFCLIPNIPIDVFAIRVKRELPTADDYSTTSSWGDPGTSVQGEVPDIVPAGEGRYESPVQTMRRWQTREPNDKGEADKVTRRHAEPVGFADIAFPIIAARPLVMAETQRAMAMGIFDQVGVCGDVKGDPLIIGQIVDCLRYGRPRKSISFLIAWNVDLRTL